MAMDLLQRRLIKWIGSIWLFGISPIYILIWSIWRLISLPFSDKIYQTGDDFIYSLYQVFVIFVYEHVARIDIIFTGDYEEILQRKENVILFSNHQSTFDWMIADILAIRQGCSFNTSIGKIRYMLKDSLKWAPLYGFYFRQYWMVVFPEGTRFIPSNTEVIEKSHEFAKKNDIEPFKYMLTPKTRGLQMAVDELRPTADAVYDITIAYSGASPLEAKAPALLEFLTSRKSLHLDIRRIAIDDIPRTNFTKWIMDSYRRKDRLLERFFADGHQNFSDESIVTDSSVSLLRTTPVFVFWTAVTMWFLLQGFAGAKYFAYITVATTLGGWIWVAYKQFFYKYY